MRTVVVERLLKKAKELGIDVIWTYGLHDYTPSVSSSKNRRIIMNANWKDKNELPFQLAHEIAHIINNNDCDIAFYHASFSSREMIEREANQTALDLILKISINLGLPFDSHKFINCFKIPPYLTDKVNELMVSYMKGSDE